MASAYGGIYRDSHAASFGRSIEGPPSRGGPDYVQPVLRCRSAHDAYVEKPSYLTCYCHYTCVFSQFVPGISRKINALGGNYHCSHAPR